jgi:hypothetical protein
MKARLGVLGIIAVLAAASASAQQLIKNGGFEQRTTDWRTSSRFVISSTNPAHGGAWSATFGQKTASTQPDVNVSGSISQLISLPASATALTLWSRITSTESDGVAHDKVSVEVLSSSGALLETLGVLSNLDSSAAYAERTFPISQKSRLVQIQLRGTSDAVNGTVFTFDDLRVDPLASISGVVSSVGGSSIANAAVSFGNYGSARTNAAGAYLLANVPCQAATFAVSADRYVPYQVSFTPACSGANTKNVTLQLLPTTVTGYVRDTDLGSGIANAIVTVGTARVLTASDGSYSLPVPCGPATIAADASRYGHGEQSFTPVCGGANVQNLSLKFYATHVTFLVGSYGVPVNGVQITFGGARPVSERPSAFAYQAVPCAPAKVQVTAPGYQTYEATYTPECNTSSYAQIQLDPKFVTVSGNVTDYWAHGPVNATVTFGGKSVTALGGAFTLSGVRCLPGLLQVTAPGYRSQVASFAPACDVPNRRDIALLSLPAAGTSIWGTLTDGRDGTPIGGVTVRYGKNAVTTTDATGSYVLLGFTCGGYDWFSTHKDGYDDFTDQVYQPLCGIANMKNLQVASRAISGRVVDASLMYGTVSLGLPNAIASFGIQRMTKTNINGDFALYPICGIGNLNIVLPGYAPYTTPAGFQCSYGAGSDGGTRALTPSGTNLFVVPGGYGAATLGDIVGTPTNEGFVFSGMTSCQPAILTVNTPYYQTARQVVTPICGKSSMAFAFTQKNATDIRGHVTDLLTGLTIGGATASFGGKTATTNASGDFTIAMVPCTTATLTVRAVGYAIYQQSYGASCASSLGVAIQLTK